MKKKITIGILAHVDAGKTTLSEALLYLSGKIRTLGRVDHGNTYLDTNAIERERGITIFSKQARFSTDECDFILLDTPGHVDFSAETERTLALLDYAILVVSAPDGVQNHTKTLWQLLHFYGVPTFIFVNKTDICIKLKEEVQAELCKSLSDKCVAFYDKDTDTELSERLAMIHEDFLDAFLAGEPIDSTDVAQLISERSLFPCFYGAALKTEGVEYFLDALSKLTLMPEYSTDKFGAKVYKISRAQNTRLTYMKITSGALSARDEISYLSGDGKKITEKISQIRLYSGDKFEQVDTVFPGEICAVSGLSATYVGEGLGNEANTEKPLLEPVLSYAIRLPEGCDPILYFPKLKELEEEEPTLHLYWNEELSEIEARLMGDIQIDLLKRLISERFGINCEFDTGKILYKEKATSAAVGIGHFEPLRHYAEVQLYIEPEPKGTGLIFDVRLPENALDTNWQRLILSHLYEKAHRGTLTGSLLTDTKITLIAGRAHVKHTEGGDFREATLRAVRHGLMHAGCTLLEPYYKFTLEIPAALVGKAMSDLGVRHAEFEINKSSEESATIVGRAPVATLHDYTREVISYTRGLGRLSLVFDGYEDCHNAEEIIAEKGYDPEGDLENTPHSVFCEHGAGILVPWQEVEAHKHLEPDLSIMNDAERIIPKATTIARKYKISDEELEAIMLRSFGPIRRKKYTEPKVVAAVKPKHQKKKIAPRRHLTIIDGYNLIHSWDSLKPIARQSLEKARETLLDMISNYAAYTKNDVIVVFDAYLVKDGTGSDLTRDGYRVVYTKEDETADAYIEKMMSKLGPDYSVRVVTGDRLVQNSAVVSGILRMTSREFEDEMRAVGNEINDFVRKLAESQK